MGRFLTLDVNFTDTTRPKVVPSLGLGAYTKRWYAPNLAGSSGDAVSSWASTDALSALTQATSGKRPTLYDDPTYGLRCVRFDGLDDDLGVAGLSAATAKTLVTVFRTRGSYLTGTAWAPSTAYAVGDQYINAGTRYRVTTAYTSGASFGATDTTNTSASPNQGVAAFSAAGLYRASSNKMQAFYSGGTAGGDVNIDKATKLTLAAGAGGEVNLLVNDDKFHVAVMRSTDGNAINTLGRSGATGYGPVDLLDVAAFPTVLADGDVTTLLDTLKTIYGSALAYT